MTDVVLLNLNFYGVPEIQEPIGIEQLAGVLRHRGFTVRLVDPTVRGDSMEETLEVLLQDPGRVLGIGAFSDQTATMKQVGELVERLRRRGCQSHVTLGGYGATIRHREYLEGMPEVGSVVLGGGEYAFPELVERVLAGRELDGLRGVAYRSGGAVVSSRPRRVDDLDALPFPARDLLEARRELYGERTMAYVLAGNGCPFQCTYCSIKSYLASQEGPVYCKKSPEKIVEEIDSVVSRYGVTNFTLLDDNFVVPDREGMDRLRALRDGLAERGLRVRLLVMTRPDSITEEAVDILKEAGVKSIFIGVEAVHPEDLKIYNRKGSQHVDRALEILKSRGFGLDLDSDLRCRIGFISFNPFSSLETLRANVDFFRRHRIPPKTLFQRVRIHKNTELRAIVEEAGLLVKGDADQHMDYSEEVYRFKHPEVASIYRLAEKLFRERYGVRQRIRRVEKCVRLQGLEAPGEPLDGLAAEVDHLLVEFLGSLVEEAAAGGGDVDGRLEESYDRYSRRLDEFCRRHDLERRLGELEDWLKRNGWYITADFHL